MPSGPPIQLDPPLFRFGMVSPGETKIRGTVLKNVAKRRLTVTAINVTGAGFSLDGVPALPLALLPEEQIQFNVQFEGASRCSCSGKLKVVVDGNRTETFSLNAHARPK